jgi:hypothetical protein
VTDASTGEEIASIWKGKDTIELPAGIYNVEIGNTAWKSVNVKPGETTVLEPGWLSVKNTTISGNKVLEKETGELFGHVSRTDDTITILPGTYDVMFGDLAWTVTIEKGKTTELLPGTVTVKSATINGHDIYDQNGNEVGSVSATGNWMPLPPGEYMIEIGEQQIEFSLKENENKVFERK